MREEYSPISRRLDPMREMRRAQADFNRMFGGLRFIPRSTFPPVNVWAGQDGAVVTAAVPGVSPEQIDVAVHQDTLTLKGSREDELPEEGAIIQRQERPRGAFARSFVLPFRIDTERVSARFDRGTLTLTLPRPEADKPRRIKVARA